jgi:hypothetical protein
MSTRVCPPALGGTPLYNITSCHSENQGHGEQGHHGILGQMPLNGCWCPTLTSAEKFQKISENHLSGPRAGIMLRAWIWTERSSLRIRPIEGVLLGLTVIVLARMGACGGCCVVAPCAAGTPGERCHANAFSCLATRRSVLGCGTARASRSDWRSHFSVQRNGCSHRVGLAPDYEPSNPCSLFRVDHWSIRCRKWLATGTADSHFGGK